MLDNNFLTKIIDKNFIINYLFHFILVFTFISYFFIYYTSIQIKNEYNSHVVIPINNLIDNIYTNKKLSISSINLTKQPNLTNQPNLFNTILDKLANIFSKSNTNTDNYNKLLINSLLIVNLIIWLTTLPLLYLYINKYDINFKDLMIQNIVIFCFMTIVEYLFFKLVISKYAPILPSEYITILLKSITTTTSPISTTSTKQ